MVTEREEVTSWYLTIGAYLEICKQSFCPFSTFYLLPTAPTLPEFMQEVILRARLSLCVRVRPVEGAHKTHVEVLSALCTHPPPHTFGAFTVGTVRLLL